MVNFRYHLVTITAIFLALAAGIVMGVSVSERVTPNLESRLLAAQDKAREVDELQGDIATWRSFGDKAAPGLLAGRLADVPVLLVAVRGTDVEVAKKVRDDLVNADARFLGTLWFTGKLELERTEDVKTLAALLDVPLLDPALVRSAALEQLAQQLVVPARGAGPTTTTSAPVSTTTTIPGASTTSTTVERADAPTMLAGLAGAGFVDIEDPAGGKLDPQAVLPASARFVVLSGEGVDVADDAVAIPFVKGLVAASGPPRAVAIEAGRPAKEKEPAWRSVFIQAVRQSGREVDGAVSTVNNVEDFRGRAALVLALADLGLARVGHYGIGPGADSLLPEAG